MADYTVNTLYDMINACNEISSEEYTDVETNIYIEKDIDLNDYSEYWVITQTLFKITTRLDNQKITIHGKGRDNINGTPHTIRNIYLSSGFIFDIIPYSTETTGATSDAPLANRTFIINDLNIECLVHKNSVDTNGPIGIFNCDNTAGYGIYYKIGYSNSFNNCIFNIKSYKSKSGNVSEQRTSMFRCYNGNIYIYFNGCIFNNEHRKLVQVSNYEHFSLIENGVNFSNVILRHCQINVRLFILDNSTSSNMAEVYISSCTLFNCFVRLTLEVNTSKNPFHLLATSIKSENSYIIIKPPANPNTTFFTTQANLAIQCYSSYSSCNFYVSEIDDISDLVHLDVSSNYKKIDPTNAKNAEYLTINVPFIVKT